MSARQRKSRREAARWTRLRYVVRGLLAKPGAMEKLVAAVRKHSGQEGGKDHG